MIMLINAKTRIIGLIGYPVEHSLSPKMHNAAFQSLGLNYCYVVMPVAPEDISEALKGIRALNILGVNVTMPHKQTVIHMLNKVDDEARFIGAVNTIINENGFLKGFNTDGRGFMESLREAVIDPLHKVVFIIGAGGAARAVGYYLAQKASKIYLYNRNQQRGLKLVQDLKKLNENVIFVENLSKIPESDIVINASSLGLKAGDPLPLNPDFLRGDHIVCDLIYWDTPFINVAKRKGCKTLNGQGMLLWQGALAFEVWTGVTPPIDVMREALEKGLGST